MKANMAEKYHLRDGVVMKRRTIKLICFGTRSYEKMLWKGQLGLETSGIYPYFKLLPAYKIIREKTMRKYINILTIKVVTKNKNNKSSW